MKIQLYDAAVIQPEQTDDEPTEVGVIIQDQHFTGYWENGTWWVDYGGITVGHRQTDWDEIEYWYHLKQYVED